MDREIPVIYRRDVVQKAIFFFFRPILINLFIYFLLLVAMLAYFVWTGGWDWLSGVFSGWALIPLSAFWLQYKAYRAQVEKYGGATRIFHFTDECISWKSENGNFELTWKNVKVFHQLQGLWILGLSLEWYIILPLDLLDEEFKKFLLAKVPVTPPETWIVRVKPWARLVFVFVLLYFAFKFILQVMK